MFASALENIVPGLVRIHEGCEIHVIVAVKNHVACHAAQELKAVA